MDHAEALELIELAAVEPDGLERLMAGDTPESSAVAGHLAGCPACVEELARIRRTATLAREVILSQPDPALRERTLAFVRDVGRDRSTGASAATGPVDARAEPPLIGCLAPAPAHPTGHDQAALGRHRGDRCGADPRRGPWLRRGHDPQPGRRPQRRGGGPPGDDRRRPLRLEAAARRRSGWRSPRQSPAAGRPACAVLALERGAAHDRDRPRAARAGAGVRLLDRGRTASGGASGRCTRAATCSPGPARSTGLADLPPDALFGVSLVPEGASPGSRS